MLDPVVKAAFIALLTAGLELLCAKLGINIDRGVLNAIAVALIAWIFHEPLASATVRGIRGMRGQ